MFSTFNSLEHQNKKGLNYASYFYWYMHIMHLGLLVRQETSGFHLTSGN